MKKIRKKITIKSGSLFDKLFTLNYNNINMMQEESSVEEKDISRAVIKRLPRYYRYLGELMEDGVERISSNELSGRMKVTASQIRQDLNNFGGFGQQGYGYNVKYLLFLYSHSPHSDSYVLSEISDIYSISLFIRCMQVYKKFIDGCSLFGR
jgi:hypothetical protein